MAYKNPETRAKYRKKWNTANAEKVQGYRLKYRAAHQKEAVDLTRKWKAANPERSAEHVRQYQATHRNQRVAYRRKRRATEKGSDGSYTTEELQALYAKYNNQCIGPGPHGGPLTPDHVIPLVKGGRNDIGNIQPLCLKCNLRKFTKTTDYRK